MTKKIFLLIIFIIQSIHIKPQETTDVDVATYYDVTLPPFGEFKLAGIVNIQNGEFKLEGSPKKETYNLGLLTIKKPTVGISNKTALSFTANAKMFGSEGKLGILEFKPGNRTIYGLIPKNEINIPLTPWGQKVSLSKITLLVTPEIMELGANIKAFNNKICLVKFGLQRPQEAIEGEEEAEPTLEELDVEAEPNNYAEVILPEINLYEIFDYLNDSKFKNFGNIKIINGKLRINNPFSTTAERTINIEGLINLESLNLPIKVKELEGSIEFNKETGITIQAEIPDISIMEKSKLSDVSLIIVIPPNVKQSPTETTTPTTSTQDQQAPSATSTPSTTSTPTTPGSPKKVNNPSIFLSGKADLDLPVVGKLSTEFNSTYDQGIFNLQSTIKKEINFENIIKFKQANLNYNSRGIVEITGDAKIPSIDIDFKGTLKLTKSIKRQGETEQAQTGEQTTPEQNQEEESDTTAQSSQTAGQATAQQGTQSATQESQRGPKQLKVGNYLVELSGTIDKDIYPFQNISGLEKIKISNPGIGIRGDKTFYITGQVDIRGLKSDAQLEFKSEKQITLKANPSEECRLSDIIKSLKNTVFDEIQLSDIQFIISTYNHTDTELNIQIKKGLNLVAYSQVIGETQKTEGLSASGKQLFKTLNDRIRIAGSVGDSVNEIYFSAAIPIKETTFANGKAILKNIIFFLSGKGPAIGLKANVLVKPSKQDNTLILEGSIAIDPGAVGLELSAAMRGNWENALGVNGLEISNVGLEGVLPSLSEMGFKGTVNISKDKEISVEGKYSTMGEVVLKGEYKGKLLLEDLIGFAIKMMLKNKTEIDPTKIKGKLPQIGLQDLLLKIAPRATTIAGFEVEPGFSLKGKMLLLNNKEGFIDINISNEGIVAKGHMDEFNIGPVKFSGKGIDGRPGATVDLTLTPAIQHLVLSGLIDATLFMGQGDVYIGLDKIEFLFKTGLFGEKIEAEVSGYSMGSIKNPSSLDFILKAAFSNELNEYLKEKISDNLSIISDKANISPDKIRAIENEKQKIKKREQIIEDYNDQIQKINDEIKKLQDEYDRIKKAKKDYGV
jgi:hypothetical protein